MKIVLLGSEGQLGREFENFLRGRVDLYAFKHKDMDVSDFVSLLSNLVELKPDIVINCAAYTNVDKAEEEKGLAYKVNVIGAKNVSFASYKVGAKVVYFSTDYVFDGRKNSPYREFDIPNPLSVYGATKLWGEHYTKEFNPNHLILRISWLYGPYGRNFVKTVVKLARLKNRLRIVNDQFGTPTYTFDVVKQTWSLIATSRAGIYHCSNEGKTTWFEFTKEIMNLLDLDVTVVPIRTSDYPAHAKRPRFSVLENYLLSMENLNIMRKWQIALSDFIKKYGRTLLDE